MSSQESDRPRGTCAVCGKILLLDEHGKMPRHMIRMAYPIFVRLCGGSYVSPLSPPPERP